MKIDGKQHYLWRAVDQDGEVVDVYLQARRDGAAAKRFFKRLIRSSGGDPRKIVTEMNSRIPFIQRSQFVGTLRKLTCQYPETIGNIPFLRAIRGKSNYIGS